MALFGRVAEVHVDDLIVSGLDVNFAVHRSLTQDPNKAEIQIYNLNSVHRQQLEQKAAVLVRLLVGYTEMGGPSQIFAGTLRENFSARDGEDWVTTLRSGDGDKDAQNARVQRSYPPKILIEKYWRELVSSMQAGIGNAYEAYRSGASLRDSIKSFSKGVVLSGSALNQLNRIANMSGLEVSVQDEELLVLERGKASRGTGVVLSGASGLIGSPERGKKGEVKVRALIIPDLVPGRLIILDSRHLKGEYRAEKIEYKGDTSANDWYAEITCKEVRR